jgi:tRNA (adenine22-N1)-methyltransferase
MVASQQYEHIWDCCCDHGLLGFALLSRNAANNIHFIDIVSELMTEVENKLQRFYATPSNSSTASWKTHCLDVAKLPLEEYEGKHLIIIAGVGGDLMIMFISAIHQQHPNMNIDFLLCPVHHQFSLREKLIELNFSLKDEMLVEDNKRFYEVIHVSSSSEVGGKIHPVGDKIWQSSYSPNSSKTSNEQAEIAYRYLNKTLSHYQRIQQGKSSEVQEIIDAYRAVTLPALTL